MCSSDLNVNIFKLSSFIDELHSMQFSTSQELVCYICETLNVTWGIPSISNSKSVPKVQKLCHGKISDAKIITNAIRFIERADDIPSASALNKLKEKFKKYAEDNEIDVDVPFPEETAQFHSYKAFEKCVIDFMCGIDLVVNRERLLKTDYAIIEKIIGTKLPSKPSLNAPTVTGEPMEAYAKIFLGIANEFRKEYASFPTSYSIRMETLFSSCSVSSDICSRSGEERSPLPAAVPAPGSPTSPWSMPDLSVCGFSDTSPLSALEAGSLPPPLSTILPSVSRTGSDCGNGCNNSPSDNPLP